MADETTQAGEETSWWMFDAFADSELPSTSFDEPLEWPEALEWGDVGDADADLQFPGAYEGASDDLSEPIFPPHGDVATATPASAPNPPSEARSDDGQPTVAVPLAALGGAAAPVGRRSGAPGTVEPLPDSIWSADRHAVARPASALGGATTVMAELDGDRSGGWRRRFDLRHGNAAVIALISFVSLVLLGMFMSVRARNDVPTDSSQTRTTSDQIAVQGTLNTVPLTVPNTTLAPPSTINLSDLVPAAEDATSATAPATGAGSGGTAATTGTTAAPRATTATTQPAAQPTNTTAAPAPVDTTTVTTAAPPVESTTVTTRPRTSTSMTLPPFPTTPGGSIPPNYTVPTFPPGFGSD